MQDNKFKWCFIGTGTLAKKVAKEILASGKHEILSVYTRNLEKGKAFTDQFGGTAYATPEEAMQAEGVQGVYVVTPHSAHYEYTKLAIELGKPVLCEKAFTTDANQAKELFTLAKEKGVYVVEGMWTWFSPVAHQVKKWLDEGAFGEIQKVLLTYHMDVRNYAPRLTDPNLAGGALLDIGVYPITYLYRLFGKPVKVECKGIVESGIDWEEDVYLTFENEKTYLASISMRDMKGLEKLLIEGSEASVHLNWYHLANRVALKKGFFRNEKFTGDGSMLNEFNLVAEEIISGRKESKYVPPQATIDVMEIMDECRRQMNLVYPFEHEK